MSRTFIIIDRPLANLLITTLLFSLSIWRWAMWFGLCGISSCVQCLGAKIQDLWEEFSPGFRLVSDRHWIYLTFASFGLLLLAPTGRKERDSDMDCRTLYLPRAEWF